MDQIRKFGEQTSQIVESNMINKNKVRNNEIHEAPLALLPRP